MAKDNRTGPAMSPTGPKLAKPQSDGEFEFYGSGWGHNCGMSQWGANAMASVYGYDCEDIIRFYFSGAYIA